jgi:tRNA (mo5U34)-methyltransferase
MSARFTAEAISLTLTQSPFSADREGLVEALDRVHERLEHGDAGRWEEAIDSLPNVSVRAIHCDRSPIEAEFDASEAQRTRIEGAMRQLRPWRKGPFRLGDLLIDSEWRCDMKWDRLSAGIGSLQGKRVLDIGCGNGWYAWRMAGAGATAVLGIDPTLLFYAQHVALAQYIRHEAVSMVPLTLEELPALDPFDTVFSMGVLYHRRSPIDHLQQAFAQLRGGGTLVLETLVVPGDEDRVLVPAARYARMRNVWFLPSIEALRIWLQRSGFESVSVISEAATTPEEQRSTDWMPFESLKQALAADDPTRTVEGLPAPVRATLTARRPL